MEIRKLEKRDAASLTELILVYKKEQDRILSEEEKQVLYDTVSALPEEKNTVTLVSESEKRITGYLNAHFVLFPLIGGIECYITELIIHPDSRGKSAGTKLLEKLGSIAGEYGAVRIMLNNHKDSESYRRAFYKKKGFRERNSFANFVKNIKH